MAVVAPLFFLLVLGLIEFARMVMVQQSVTNAAREGCRHAALTTTSASSSVDAVVRDQLSSTIANSNDTDDCRVTISPSDLSTIAENTEIIVNVEVDYSNVSWLPPSFLGGAVIRAKATVKRE